MTTAPDNSVWPYNSPLPTREEALRRAVMADTVFPCFMPPTSRELFLLERYAGSNGEYPRKELVLFSLFLAEYIRTEFPA